jgi:prepilin-type N-terminal cleavage/methylation domain-containing protein
MTRRPTSQRPSRRAFTLIEIVITLTLIGLLITMGLVSTQNLSHTRSLHEPMAKLREFAKKARNLAIIEQRPYQVEIMPHSVAIYSVVTQGVAGTEAAPAQGRVDFFPWDNDVGLTARRWRAKDFAPPGRQVWIFERSGLCEPITVRAESEYGFVEMAFNALDAHVEDETSEIH